MKVTGPKSVEFDDKERQFIRLWKRYFRAPGDWKAESCADGTSSFLDWAEFLAPETVSLNLLDGILAGFAAQDETPALFAVKRAYSDKTAGAAHHVQPGQECGVCRGTGVFEVALAYANYPSGHGVPLNASTARKVPRTSRVSVATVPCKCSVGARVASRRQFPPAGIDRFWPFRLAGLTERLRLEELLVTDGLLPGQDAAPPDTGTGIAESDWPAPQLATPEI